MFLNLCIVKQSAASKKIEIEVGLNQRFSPKNRSFIENRNRHSTTQDYVCQRIMHTQSLLSI